MPAAGEIHRLKKRRLPAGFLAGDESVNHNGHFNPSLSRLNLIYSRQPNNYFLATTLHVHVSSGNLCGRCTGLVVSALVWDSGSRGPGLSPGWVIVLCSWARHYIQCTLTVPLSTQEYKWVLANCEGNLTKC